MNLIIDIGNTNTTTAVFNGKKLVYHKKIRQFTLTDLENIFLSYNFHNSILSAVGEIPGFLLTYHKSQKINLIELNHLTKLPLKIEYNTPETLGMDRIAGVAGAMLLHPCNNCLVIDAGTAITYDFINNNGVYKGGSISPGLQLRFKSLNDYTTKLPLVDINSSFPVIGTSTKTAIQSGVQNGMLYEIKGQIAYFKKNYDDLKVILTGGDAQHFDKKLKKTIFVVPNLISLGLNYILEHNVK